MNYHIGDRVHYRIRGVYKIEAIGTLSFLPDNQTVYYTLRPFSSGKRECVYLPVHAEQYIKPLMSPEEALSTLENLHRKPVKPVRSLKMPALTAYYQTLLFSGNINKHLQLFQEVCQKETKALKRGKKPGETEQQFKRKVEHLLSEELGAILNESPDLSKKRLYDAAQVFQ
mgnify:CR=1 FL=1